MKMEMLKDEPKMIYIYRCIKDNTKANPLYKKGFEFETENSSLDEKYFKPLWEFRQAFIGDMQEKLDKGFNRNHLLDFAKSAGGCKLIFIPKEYVYEKVYEKIYIKENIFKQFQEWWKERKENKHHLDNILYKTDEELKQNEEDNKYFKEIFWKSDDNSLLTEEDYPNYCEI